MPESEPLVSQVSDTARWTKLGLRFESAGADRGLAYVSRRWRSVEFSVALSRPEVGWWTLDFGGPGLKRLMNGRTGLSQSA